MAEPHWTGYVGMITGLIGAITGIVGAIMGYLGYRKSNKLKSLDLKIELRKNISDAHADLTKLQNLIEDADRSKQQEMARKGLYKSGAMIKWNNELQGNRAKIEKISKILPTTTASYNNRKAEDLESELINIHSLRGDINRILDHYS